MGPAELAVRIFIGFFPYAFFALFTFKNNLRVSFRTAICIICGLCAVFIGMYEFLNWNWPKEAWTLPAFALFTLVVCIVLYHVVKVSFAKIFFVYLVMITLEDNCRYLAKLIPGVVSGSKLYYTDSGFFSIYLMLMICSWCFLYWLVKEYIRPLIDNEENDILWKYLWSVPALFVVLFRISINPQTFYKITEATPLMLISESIWFSGNCFVYYVILKMLTDLSDSIHLRNKLRVADVELSMQKEQYRQLQENIEEVRKAHHDFRHVLAAIKKYLADKNYQELSDYLDSYAKEAVPEQMRPLCENYAVDAICQYYLSMAKRRGILVKTWMRVPELDLAKETDLGVVFGNLLENAVEASAKCRVGERFIEVRCDWNGSGTLVIMVSNSCEHQAKKKQGVFLSSKRDGTGIGTESVRSIARKYHGLCEYSQAGGVFQAHVMLNLEPAELMARV